jgi:hypothetical protein
VQNGSQTNIWVKWAWWNGIQRTPSSAGSADYYVYIDDTCGQWDRTVTVEVDEMEETWSNFGAQPIPAANQRTSSTTDGVVYRFNNSVYNGLVTAPVITNNTSLDTPQTVLIHENNNPNGIGWEYGMLMTHDIEIPQYQIPTTYQWAFMVNCVNCS